ncbi:MAG: GTP-binding protein Era [Verrucomicrobiales bacterium]|jgi:GTP-binding protein Era
MSEFDDPTDIADEPDVGDEEPAISPLESMDFGGFRSGFVTLVGRPNVGKSTLLNKILGEKVSIVSDKPQTTRSQVRGVLHRPDLQLVFVDTPGIHKPRGPLGKRLNSSAESSIGDVDAVCVLIDATMPIGPGDKWVVERCPKDTILVVNKTDKANPEQVLAQLSDAAKFDLGAYFPVSALTGDGVPELVAHLATKMPEGPPYYPEDMVSDAADAFWVAELVREQLLAVLRDEIPHSIATRVTEMAWPHIRCEILVERDSQKGIVIGKKGAVLKQVGIEARKQLREGTYLDLQVKVSKNWQSEAALLDRLGY